MSRKTFKRSYVDGKPHAVQGRLLNARANEANVLANERPTGASQTTINASIRCLSNPPKPLEFGIAAITGGSHPTYTAQFRVYKQTDAEWANYDEDLTLDASVYWEPSTTQVSQTPAAGVGYGHIPAYGIGDVVPAYWDATRMALVPVHSPFADKPMAEYAVYSSIAVPKCLTHQQEPDQRFVNAYLEVWQPGWATWRSLGSIHWNMPKTKVDRFDSRTGIATFSAPSTAARGTYVRVRVVKGGGVNEDIRVFGGRLQFRGAGRDSAASVAYNLPLDDWAHSSGGVVVPGWATNATVAGRFNDVPSFSHIGSGVFEITYSDPIDNWIIASEFQITLRTFPSAFDDERVYIARTYTALPGMRGLGANPRPGEGTVTLYKINEGGTLGKCLDEKGNERQETAYNLSWVAVAADTFIHIKREDCSDKFLVDFDPCGDPTL